MSDLDRFELFVYVAQAHSLTAAADSLNITKAALSKQIKKLESEFKVDLFSRQGHRLRLTTQGEILLEQSLRLKKELENTRAVCHQFHQEPEGMLSIVAFTYFAKRLIFPRLAAFLKRYPKLELTIDTHERIPNFEQEQVDLAVGFTLPAPPDIVRRRMMKLKYVLCASPAYYEREGKPKKLEDLTQHYYIGHSKRPKNRTLFLKPGYKLYLEPRLYLNSVYSMIECARMGVGLIQLPSFLVEEYIDSGELVETLNNYQGEDVNIYYYYPKYRYVQPKVRKFIDYFMKEPGS